MQELKVYKQDNRRVTDIMIMKNSLSNKAHADIYKRVKLTIRVIELPNEGRTLQIGDVQLTDMPKTRIKFDDDLVGLLTFNVKHNRKVYYVEYALYENGYQFIGYNS